MNRIDALFQSKPREVLSVYFTAGYPYLDATPEILEALEEAGVDMVEVGIPFSDPMVDGPVIQESNKLALENGMSLNLLFDQISKIREKINIPLLLMGYLNPVFHYGVKKFSHSCRQTGIDGVILPDLPLEIYQQHYKKTFEENNLHNVFLVTPSTRKDRLAHIVKESSGFVYMVSSSSTTGGKKDIRTHLSYVNTIHNIKPEIPVMVGFGINNRKKFLTVCEQANGGIIGSAFISILAGQGDLKTNITSFIRSIKLENRKNS